MQPTNTRLRRQRLVIAGAVFSVALGLIAPSIVGATVGKVPTRVQKGVELAAHQGVFGSYLVVASGPLAGYSLYSITSDAGTTFGCTTQVFHGPGGATFPCTGPATSHSAEWPALTTAAAPVAGPGVNAAMLRSVYRKGIGHQVVYNDHPLYLFDQSPGQITGEGWDEPSFPPWHGSWWLVNPSGTFEESAQTLTDAPLASGKETLSVIMIAGGGAYAFPVYSDSADTPTSSACSTACARRFEPVLTTGSPGIEGSAVTGAISTITRSDGTKQITYDGHPLYLYALEGITPVPGRGFAPTGSGSGASVGGGTFSLVTP
jgi:predicted lipoprotein with Yx(FWY)xxD motif